MQDVTNPVSFPFILHYDISFFFVLSGKNYWIREISGSFDFRLVYVLPCAQVSIFIVFKQTTNSFFEVVSRFVRNYRKLLTGFTVSLISEE